LVKSDIYIYIFFSFIKNQSFCPDQVSSSTLKKVPIDAFYEQKPETLILICGGIYYQREKNRVMFVEKEMLNVFALLLSVISLQMVQPLAYILDNPIQVF
jgi:hypothetical protein